MHHPTDVDETDAMEPLAPLKRPQPDFLPREFVLELRGDAQEMGTRLFRGIRKLKELGYDVKQKESGDALTILTVTRARRPRRPFRRLEESS